MERSREKFTAYAEDIRAICRLAACEAVGSTESSENS